MCRKIHKTTVVYNEEFSIKYLVMTVHLNSKMQNWYISVIIPQENLVHKNNLAKILVCISEVAVRILDNNFFKDFIYLFGLGGGPFCLLGGLSW